MWIYGDLNADDENFYDAAGISLGFLFDNMVSKMRPPLPPCVTRNV